jgi:hypothetical protein
MTIDPSRRAARTSPSWNRIGPVAVPDPTARPVVVPSLALVWVGWLPAGRGGPRVHSSAVRHETGRLLAYDTDNDTPRS